MRIEVKTRFNVRVSVEAERIVEPQYKIVTNGGTFYHLHLKDRGPLELSEPVPDLRTVEKDLRKDTKPTVASTYLARVEEMWQDGEPSDQSKG